MTLRGAYGWGFGVAITLALLAVLLGGEMPGPFWLALAVVPLSAWMQHRGTVMHGAIGTVIGSLGLFAGMLLLVQQGLEASLLAAGIVLVALLVGRLLTRETLAHDLQALLLSLLLVFSGTVLHTQITYGIVFVAYALAVVWALVTRQLVAGAHREAQRRGGAAVEVTLARRDIATPAFAAVTSLVALIILVSTVALFLLFPRIGLGNLAFLSRGRGGFPHEVTLDGTPRAVLGSGTVMARVWGLDYARFREGLYLRGPVYDRLTVGGFELSPYTRGMPPSRLALAAGGAATEYDVFMQPLLGSLMLSLGPVDTIRIVGGGQSNPSHRTHALGLGPSGEVLAGTALRGPIRYRVQGSVVTLSEHRRRRGDEGQMDRRTEEVLTHYLDLPEELDPQVFELARSLVAGTDPTAKRAEALRQHLLSNFTYTLEGWDQRTAADPIAAFLLEHRQGHCEYFATAYATLLRAVGIPSRVVGGFHGGLWDSGAEVVVFTTANAHAWVEWYLPGVGWVVDDATPASSEPPGVLGGFAVLMERMVRIWDDYVLDYSLTEQVEIAAAAARSMRAPWLSIKRAPWKAFAGLVATLALVALAFWLWSRRRPALSHDDALGRALLAAVERLGGAPVEETSTVREAVIGLEDVPPDVATVLEEGLVSWESYRYGGRVPGTARRRELLRALSAVRPR